MGDKIWQTLAEEHQLDTSGNATEKSLLYDNQTICKELTSGKYIPRNLFIDTSP